MKIIPMTKELEEKARKELNEDERRDDHLRDLKLWFNQNYENEKLSDTWLLNYLRGCKFDQERTRHKLENFFSIKLTMKQIYENRDPCSAKLEDVFNRGILLPLPRPDIQIMLVRWADCDTSKVSLLDAVKAGIMYFDAFLNDSDTVIIIGHHVIIDCTGLPFSYITQMSPSIVRNIIYILFRTYPTRIKGIYVINCFSLTQILYNIIKPFLQKKMISRIHFFSSSNYKDIEKHISLAALPYEYGGQGGTLANIINENKKFLQQRRAFFVKGHN